MKEETVSTADPDEIERFSRLAGQWWDPGGAFKPLHRINPLRIKWIVEQSKACFQNVGDNVSSPSSRATRHVPPLHGLTLLDIGCGGGLVCEPMRRLGAQVTGIDASEQNIQAAQAHARHAGLDIDYRCLTAEEMLGNMEMGGHGDAEKKEVSSFSSPVAPYPRIPISTHPPFDIVLALEIIEHVADIPAFVAACCALVRPGGLMVWSTLNRTAKSYALAILGAEVILRWLPRGTHDWTKFVKPSELHKELRKNGIAVTAMTGMVFHPLTWGWRLDARDVSVNYLMAGKKD